MLARKNEELYSHALKYLGSILVSDDHRIAEKVILDDIEGSNALNRLASIMHSSRSCYFKESLWLLSNLSASGAEYSKTIIASSVMPRVLTLARSHDLNI